jgi:hypothetical protein
LANYPQTTDASGIAVRCTATHNFILDE